ncbi:MAG: response regulator transcription factor [Spirochaetia bacterium]|nr:response regulator transcription factor [Spirochaetia bacterium]MCF7946575.1 response regulator transcription factor [Spirochaetia bacterium]MCF7952919.1 response regulator transcription factor [Spirochaetales bacterium]
MSKETILIVDDEADIRELITYNLEREGYRIITAVTGEEALTKAQHEKPALIVLDLMLPGIDGLEVCRALSGYEIPILMVTAKSEDSDIIIGLEMGADDYITKPFSPRVLVARVRALLRRHKKSLSPKAAQEKLSLHNITIDTAKHQTFINGETVELSVTEFGILEFLLRNPGWVFSRSQIIEAVKGADYPVTERSVDVQVLALRRKLGKKGEMIETVRGIGYRMLEEEQK